MTKYEKKAHEMVTEAAKTIKKVEAKITKYEKKAQKRGYVERCLDDTTGPIIASTDYMRAFPDQIRPYVHRRYVTLGTDGFGRSDSREALRRFFEVDRHHVVLAALKALADDGVLPATKAAEAIARYGIDADRANPVNV